jgi:hypothetical protein
MKRFFTFEPESKYTAAERLVFQATKTEIFDEVVSYTDMDLQCMSDFWDVHGEFVDKHPIMFGYGIWKPYLVMKELEGLNDGDILFYADPGCDFDLDCENPKEEFEKIVANLKDHKFIASTSNSLIITDRNMTKMDAVKYMDMEDHPGYLTEQIQATTFVLEKCERTSKFVKEWYELCSHYHLINDDESVVPNNPTDYNDHRHEQSVMSLLLKKRAFYPVPDQITIESVICLSNNRSGTHYPACRVTGSSLYSLHFGDEFIEGSQIVQMSNLIRKYNPQTILETGFGSGRTAATMIQSKSMCHTLPILKYVNVDKNYSLYNPISSNFRKYCQDMCPFFKTFERRSSDLLRTGFMEEEFPEGIDWFTVDGDPTYPGCLYELVSGLKHMKKGGIIYVVADRVKRKNVDIKEACDFFEVLFASRLIKKLDDVCGKEICYFVVTS